MTPFVDIIVPARNEQHRIAPMLRSYFEYYKNKPVQFTIVLNDCTDDTKKVVEKEKEDTLLPVRIIEIPEAIGKGGAIMEAWRHSQGDLLAFVDADGATPPKELDRILQAASKHDGAIGTRFHKEAKIFNRHSQLRTIMSHLFQFSVKLIFWMPYSDTQCGAKAFKKDIIIDVLPHVHTTNLNFDLDLLWQLHKKKRDVVEVPTAWHDKEGSSTLGSRADFLKIGISMLLDIFSIRLR